MRLRLQGNTNTCTMYVVHFAHTLQFLLLMMGLNNATSTYACLWCTVAKEERCDNPCSVNHLQCICCMFRWDMSVPEEVYCTAHPRGKARTLAGLLENSRFSQPKRHLGSKNTPLLPLEPTCFVLDELHLFLRISDVLLRNVILQADHLDQQVYMAEG